MKLQKIFRRSFSRSSKDENNTTSGKDATANSTITTTTAATKKPKLFSSRSLDETSSSNPTSPRASNGIAITSSTRAPLAGKEESPEIDLSKKVTFREMTSPEGIIDNINHHEALFDDGMLKAFEVGNLSIAQFLESPHTSPDTTPTTTLLKKSKEKENGTSTPTHTPSSAISSVVSSPRKSQPCSPMKKPSLLDQAHAKGGNNSARIPPSPALRKQIAVRSVSVEASNEKPQGSSERRQQKQQEVIQSQQDKNKEETKKHRFSKSLEHLAQQVFGEEFQKHLEDASKQSIKIPISVSDDPGRPSLSRSKTLSPRVPVDNNNSLKVFTLPCPNSEPPNRRSLLGKNTQTSTSKHGLQRCHSASNKSDIKKPSSSSNSYVTSARSIDIPYNDRLQTEVEPPLESWDNKLDLSSRNSISSSEVPSKIRMLPVIEGEVLTSPRKNIDDAINQAHGIDRRRAKSVGSVGNSITDASRLQSFHTNSLKAKLIKTDSEVANYGSASEKDLSASESSVLEIQFPPPPPVEEGLSMEQIEVPEEAIAFDWEVLSDEGGHSSSLELNLNTDCGNDALIESLMSIVPLPEHQSDLRPALTKALGEIVSEIVSSRRKLNRLFKAIEIHQQILKEQSKKIESQTKEIAHLRLITFGIEHGLSNSTTVKLRGDNNRKVRRPQSARTYRQSREMVELNYTLDKLLYQCSSLRNASNEKQTDHNGTSTGTSVQRSKSFPSRERVQLKASNNTLESEC